ncbi:unnamed protein product [Eruca vesicaria subsp. sativa]|uniref:Uncharacterized protein n=1 Tax=Eruca vesicaria subsp. sativa TaxID=29727 RepID=A0ABC8JST7_ERUVS|nr:unnamed protein product [Eruca vesicaria subsp. sativa]
MSNNGRGNTKYNPNLLKYSCHIHCGVRPVSPAVVTNPLEDEAYRNYTSQESLENERRLSVAVMLSKPIIALQFKDLTMQVEAPVVVHPKTKQLHSLMLPKGFICKEQRDDVIGGCSTVS